MKAISRLMIALALPGTLAVSLSACSPTAGEYVHHPHPGIDQIECPPPARPKCSPD